MPERERRLPPEVDRNLAQAYATTFISRLDLYPIQLKDGRYITVKGALTTDQMVAHIEGKITLGAYALNAESIARWLCLDADEEEHFALLKTVAVDLTAKNVSSYLEQSRRGGHLWLFTPPLPGKTVRDFARRLLVQYGLPKLEIYPKQDVLTSGVGSLVRLPLGFHRKSGKRYHFITPDNRPIAPTIRQQMAILSAPVRITQEFIEQTLATTIEPTSPPEKTALPPSKLTPGEQLSERIRAAMSVYDFIRHYVELDETGKGLCPFHDDHVQSFQVNIERNYWNCYAGCGGGSLIDFWMKWREAHGQDSSFTVTIKDLAEKLF